MEDSDNELVKQVKGFIDRHGNVYPGWYVGITEAPRRRLFDEHGVDEDNDLWIFESASSHEAARAIEKYFTEGLGTDGGPGGGDEDAETVYSYKKEPHTDP